VADLPSWEEEEAAEWKKYLNGKGGSWKIEKNTIEVAPL